MADKEKKKSTKRKRLVTLKKQQFKKLVLVISCGIQNNYRTYMLFTSSSVWFLSLFISKSVHIYFSLSMYCTLNMLSI